MTSLLLFKSQCSAVLNCISTTWGNCYCYMWKMMKTIYCNKWMKLSTVFVSNLRDVCKTYAEQWHLGKNPVKLKQISEQFFSELDTLNSQWYLCFSVCVWGGHRKYMYCGVWFHWFVGWYFKVSWTTRCKWM